MDQNIILFVVFSLAAAGIYRFIPLNSRRYYLLLINSIFYLLCDGILLLLVLFSALYSYFIVQRIQKCEEKYRKLFLAAGILPVILLLAYFKYCNFFIKSDDFLILMPLGLSYYSFKIISYELDVYRKKKCAEENVIDYLIYISFFAQIICGPITRVDSISNYIRNRIVISSEERKEIGTLVISGLFKKLVIADRLSIYVERVFAGYESLPWFALWMAAFFYSVQLYCDFAGYSEIAVGITRLFGFECIGNFKNPYLSKNIKEFWSRWHISLSLWLRDYVYIPLGGNRKGVFRKNLNLVITFLISGIWHGNGWNYVLWGAYHGVLNIFPLPAAKNKVVSFVYTVITFISVMFGWIIFKTESLYIAVNYMKQMFTISAINMGNIIAAVMPFTNDYSCLAYLMTVLLFIFVLLYYELKEYKGKQTNLRVKVSVYLLAVIFFSVLGQNSFLYANY